MGRKRNFLLGWKTKLLPGAGFDSSHRVPAGQIPPFFLPRAGPQLRPRDLTGGQNRFFPHEITNGPDKLFLFSGNGPFKDKLL